MTLELTLTAKPESASPCFANNLYANSAVLNDDLFVVESQRGDVLSRDVHTCYLTRDQTRQLRDEITAFLGDEPGTRGCTCRFVHDLDQENEQLRQRVASLEKDADHVMCRGDRLCATAKYHIDRNVELQKRLSARDDAIQAYRTANDKQYLRLLDLEKENAALKARVRELSERDRYDVVTANIKAARAEEENEKLERENAALKVDLMNARADRGTRIVIGDWHR